MKRIIIIGVAGLALGGALSACRTFLDEKPKDRVVQTNYYQTEQDAVAALNSVYAYLGSYSTGSTAGVYHSTFWVTAGLASDELLNNQLGALQNDQLANFTYNSENSNLLEIWQMHYKTITLANIAVARIPGIAMDATERTQLVNEAKFLRGLLYFNLVRMFGSVPLVLDESGPLTPTAASADEVYAQIVRDLTDAEGLPPRSVAAPGRATRGAAQALLAKVYLTRQDYQNAATKARQVIDSNEYALWDNFADVFKLANRGGKEAVFSVGFGDANGAISFWEVGQFNVRLLPVELAQGRAAVSNTQGWQYATNNLYDAFDAQDTRKAVTFLTQFVNDQGATVNLSRVYIQKYWDQVAEPGANGSANDFPVIRYPDVLLTYAEAQAGLGNLSDAATYLNLVRKRAGLSDLSPASADALREAVLSERRKEFVAEGQRWFDLVRTGQLAAKVQDAKGITVPSTYNLFPLPQRERTVNPNLPQNPGY